ncbi:MAG TPA: type IV secretion system protein TraC [Rhodanobacteraceae bacterium]|nr:type IV secretion system protein TraC [Rhodanobacteraceae bacterium]
MHEKDALLAKLFSAMACDPETNLFVMDDGALGFGAWCRPVAGVDQAVKDKLNLLLNLALPKDSVMQFIAYTSPDISATTEAYRLMRRGATKDVFVKTVKERVAFLESATRLPLDSVSGLRLHETNLLIVVRLPGYDRSPTEEEIKRASELRNTFMQTVRSIGMSHQPLTAERYVRFMETVLNHRPDAAWRDTTEARVNDSQLLCHQILDPNTDISVDPHGLWLGDGARVRMLHVKRYPEYVHFGMALKYIGDYVAGARGIRENVLITANVLFLDHQAASAKIDTDQKWTTRNASLPIAKYVTQWGLRKESLDLAARAIEDGDRIVRAYLGMAVFTQPRDSTPEALRECEAASVSAAANARAYFREFGYQLLTDEHFCEPLFIQLLPFAAEAAIATTLMRYITLPTRYVVPLLPVLGAWRGTGTPLLTMHSRDGQLMTLSPFDSDGGYNTIIAAQTGSGKSFLTNAKIEAMLSTGGRVWVIDVGYSYQNLNRLLGGYYMQFSPEADICLNPFSLVKDLTDEGDVIAGILQTMAAPTSALTDFQMAQMKRVMVEVFERHGQDTSIDLLAEALLAEGDTRLVDIGHQLFPFTSRGDFGRYFNGRNNFEVSNPFIVCELQELSSRPHLQRVVLQQLMFQIQQQMDFGDRAQRKLLVIDEAWSLLAQEGARNFIVSSYRRIRKHGGSACVVTQSVNDLWSNAGAIAIVENSANVYLLRQKAESINMIKKEQRLSLGEAGYRLLETVHTVPGEYSEILVVTQRGTGVARLVVSDFQKLLFTTNAEEVTEIKKLQAEGLTLVQAIEHIAIRRRGGQRAGSMSMAA